MATPSNNPSKIPSGTSTSDQQTPPCLTALPDEVLQHLITYLSPSEVLQSVQLVSKRFRTLASDPLLWRHHCKVEFRCWDSRHRIREKFSQDISDVEWEELYRSRARIDARTTRAFESILASQTGRIVKFDLIRELGYDAKDALLRHCNPPADAPDVLARQYFAYAVLDHIHRYAALLEWRKLSQGQNIPIENALGAYDMFVLHDQVGDFLEISDLLDEIASRIRHQHADFDSQSIREKALITVRFLRANNLVGLSSEAAYRDLQNNFIGIALQDKDHPSLPLVSTVIFCAVARRLGLDAACAGIPNHVHALITAPAGHSLDSSSVAAAEDTTVMYLDPYRFEAEIPLSSITFMLSMYNISANNADEYITDTGNANLILRTSRNILATINEVRMQAIAHTQAGHPTIQLHSFNPYTDLDNAYYASLWANYMCTTPGTQGANSRNRTDFIPLILQRFERIFPMDAALIEEFIMSQNHDGIDNLQLPQTLEFVRDADQMVKTEKTRGPDCNPKFRVGQVFQHKRYGYWGIITGWDLQCGMDPVWIAENEVDQLSGGRTQSFYNAIIEDTSYRYVAEENIGISKPDMPPQSLVTLAGKYFKRWDKDNHVFVSNIQDEYPED